MQLWNGPPSASARARADAWARSLEGRVLDVRSSPGRDEFSETVAIIERPFALPPASADPLRELASELVGPNATVTDLASPPSSIGLPPIIRGRVEADGLAHHVALA